MLSQDAKNRLTIALTSEEAGNEVSDAIDSGSNPQAATVAAISGVNLVGVDGTGSNAAPLAGTETRLDAIESKINAILTALKNAGLMA